MHQSSAKKADSALLKQYSSLDNSQKSQLTWPMYDGLIESVIQSNKSNWSKVCKFHYRHPTKLQDKKYGLGKSYVVPVAYSDSGNEGEPVIAIGGLTNVFQRFDFLAIDASPDLRLIGLDLVGRGRSGWMSDISDYTTETYIEQTLQLLDVLKLNRFTILGSSLGGSIAISIAARYPSRVKRIILNDIGPYIPFERRARRAISVARYYVFHNPAQMFRKSGAAVKYMGPAPDAVLLHISHNKTCWSEVENGRIYKHDLRCLLAYRKTASTSLDQWDEWDDVKCPVLLLHGMKSDAVSNSVVDRMRQNKNLSVIQIEEAGHTPTLADKPLIEFIVSWVENDDPYPRDRMYKIQYNPKRILYPH